MSSGARLVWERRDGRQVEFPLDGDSLELGREEGVAIRVDEPLVSRRHARLERRGGAWVVVDLGSTNFTRVNGERVLRERELAHGDELRLGRARCRFLAERDGLERAGAGTGRESGTGTGTETGTETETETETGTETGTETD